jgi:hypothetical protein
MGVEQRQHYVIEGDQTISDSPCTSTAPGRPRRPGGMTKSNCRIIPTVADSGGPWICALTGSFARSDLALRRGSDPRAARMLIESDGWARRGIRRPAGTGFGEGVVGHGLAHDREARHSGPSMRPRSPYEVKGSDESFQEISGSTPHRVANVALTRMLTGPLGYGVTAGAAHPSGRVSD